ncbi:MAG TPA: hypothetical protein VFF49_11175 [Thermodesulfobacteriota bacterium]|nr:hypothetical protein [Thermodesulfobacteriota bacterium]
MLDSILEKAGLKYEDLNPSEKETLNVWLEALQKGALSVEKIKEYITSMKEAVEQELCKSNIEKKQDLFLKARLRNYMLLDAFLSTPERAKQQMENAVSSIVGKKVG